jgi:predicted AlkP superfamily pyrophosphatase or phosphodiesterase
MKRLLVICALFFAWVPVYAALSNPPPRLVVVIVVDQFRPDYLDRFGDLFTGGFARILREGTVFDHAYHDHSCTVTGAGHATLSTGCVPAHHGIINNSWLDRTTRREVYCCDDSTSGIVGYPTLEGLSPWRMERPTVAEWLKQSWPAAKVVSLGIKNRSAIFLAGHKADAVFWYENDLGRFVTSRWYADSIPTWMSNFQTSGYVDSFSDSVWTRLLPDSAYARSGPDRVPYESDGEHTEFPHRCNSKGGAPGPAYYEDLLYTPFGDRVLLELAERAVKSMQLGTDSIPDLLMVACSCADLIGHEYGPNSQEVEDYYLRLDRYLGKFFDSLDVAVGRGGWLLAMGSDHGVMPIPELEAHKGLPARRLLTDSANAQVKALALEVSRQRGVPLGIWQVDNGFAFGAEAWADTAQCRAAGDDLANRLRSLDWVADIYAHWELADPTTPNRPFLNLFRNAWHADRGADLYLRETEYTLIASSPYGTSHGTAYTYDTRVPLLFMGPLIPAARISDSVRTVDLAPTLCDWLGVLKPDVFDGVTLAARIRH